ncbi:transposase [Blautia wexlerae]
MDNRSLSHTRWKCQYHIVFIPKYRKKVVTVQGLAGLEKTDGVD